MINPFEMVILIVLVVTVGKVLMARRSDQRRVEDDPAARVEAIRLQDEVKQLKERIQVLERIATDKEDSLSREIDRLRDR